MTHSWDNDRYEPENKGGLSPVERKAAVSLLKVLENPRSERALSMLFAGHSDATVTGAGHWDFAQNGMVRPTVRHIINDVVSMQDGKPVVNRSALDAKKASFSL